MKLLKKVAIEARLDSRVRHLEEETLFGTAKRKLDLPPGDDSDSHCHNRVNYSIPMLRKGMSLGQAWIALKISSKSNDSQSPVRSSISFSIFTRSISRLSLGSDGGHSSVLTSNGLLVLESVCFDCTRWHIERISSHTSKICRGCFEGRRCTTKIANYRQEIAASTFTRVERHCRSTQSEQVQF